eukprot:1313956-Amphidinium_carterae.1
MRRALVRHRLAVKRRLRKRRSLGHLGDAKLLGSGFEMAHAHAILPLPHRARGGQKYAQDSLAEGDVIVALGIAALQIRSLHCWSKHDSIRLGAVRRE